MNGPSKITVDYSSLVGLKAEVLRKQLEVKELKARGPVQNIPSLQKPKVKVKKTHKEDEGSPKVTEIEDVSTLKKSQLMLEAKSRLYDKLQKSRSNASDLFLVDFSQKPDTESKKSKSEDDLGDEDYDSDDNFVEYQDCFGRTRKCLREDLPKMREKDHLLRQKISKETPAEPEPEPQPVVEPKMEEPLQPTEIELMRKKWEEQTKKLANKVNIHYQDVLFDEARAHGVGYFNFSLDEDERQKQRENLDKLRKETEKKQKEIKELKETRKKMEQNRLRVARIRQRIRAGLSPELPEDEVEVSNNAENSGEVKPEISDGEKKKPEEDKKPENSLAIIEDKVKAFGELLGKRTQWREMSQEEWVDKRRKDRLSEFAPTYSGFKSAGCIEFGNAGITEDRRGDFTDLKTSSPMDEDEKDDDSEVIGPMPISVPLLTTNPPPSIPVPSSWNENKSLWHEKRFELDDDSDDSDIIGPMPPVDFPAFIPLPPDPPPSTIPLPPPPKESISQQQVSSGDLNLTVKSNIDTDRIAAGLRFLREKFEKEKKKGS
ncbi:coiled-coil domain-containing protein 174 [Belonocnema kinseyi]|uniref:coiled-coil domain-containing protein 174 n=1 Tax=Belonocnema kinseyi TaxID=2817044 RepID=UPI00143DC7B6|nr:coiled-coil domain-containing protein 174 [Belonocnema kinseyi]